MLADKYAVSTREVGRFETENLSTKDNLKKLMDLSGKWIDKVHRRRPLGELILDMDSSVSETYGRQEDSAYNGHFGGMCYHPLLLFNQFGANAVLERKTRFGDKEAGVEGCRTGRKMLDFFADSPIPATSMDQAS